MWRGYGDEIKPERNHRNADGGGHALYRNRVCDMGDHGGLHRQIKRPAVMSEPAGLVNSEAIHKVYICIIADEKGKSNEI